MTNDQYIKIQNRFLDDVAWMSPSANNFKIGGGIDVYRVCISLNLPLLSRFSSTLNTDELARGRRYLQLNDTNRFIISRGALRAILGKYLDLQASEIEFEIGPNKKPHIKNTNDAPLHYNVSHSGDWIVIGVSNAEIGVDVEHVNPAFDFKDIIAEYFSAAEISYINSDQSHHRFFELWTRKEALTKGTGKGLDEDLKFIPSLDGEHQVESTVIKSQNDWLVSTLQLCEKYTASIAESDSAKKINFWDIIF